tara:strand:- start:2857 stop:4251 length:1395 start_codon:yes stop_codon:yes gene_type:complete
MEGASSRVAVVNLVGLCRRHLGDDMPRITAFAEHQNQKISSIRPVLPALTCSAQATYLTGKLPSEHGIVGNGWYDRDLNEHHFWKQSNALVGGEKIWESVRKRRPELRTAKLFWWYNMYSSAEISITPRPLYASDGNKVFDIHSQPMALRDEIKNDLGEFPFPSFWGPMAGIASSQWIADSARWVEEKHHPDLSLIYLPHLDYDLQRFGPEDARSKQALREIDQVAGELIEYLEQRGITPLVLSEYGISKVDKAIFPNREFRHQGWLSIKQEFGGETLDCGGSRAFALTDHQMAHIYLNQKDGEHRLKVRSCLEAMDGVARVLEAEELERAGLQHPRSGDLVALAEENAWFAYYHWEEDEKAPEFARCIDIHRKYGYDPAELFLDPDLNLPKLRVLQKLLAKKMGFRTRMDLIPLDAGLVHGSHGVIPENSLDWPVILAPDGMAGEEIEAVDIFEVIQKSLANS